MALKWLVTLNIVIHILFMLYMIPDTLECQLFCLRGHHTLKWGVDTNHTVGEDRKDKYNQVVYQNAQKCFSFQKMHKKIWSWGSSGGHMRSKVNDLKFGLWQNAKLAPKIFNTLQTLIIFQLYKCVGIVSNCNPMKRFCEKWLMRCHGNQMQKLSVSFCWKYTSPFIKSNVYRISTKAPIGL